MLSRTRFIVLSVFLDALLVNVGVVLAFLVRFGGTLPAFNFGAYLVLAPFTTAIYLMSAWAYGLYDPERMETAWSVIRSVTAAVTLGTVLDAAIAFFGGERTASFARSTLLIGWAFGIMLLVGWRLLFLRFGRIRWPEQRVIIVGTGPVSVELADELTRRAKWGWRVCGLLDANPGEGACEGDVGGYPLLGSAHDVARIAREQDANRIIVVSPVALRELVESLVLADELRVRVDVVPELYEIFIGRVDALIGDIPLMKITESFVPRYYRAAKRVIDLVGASVMLVLVSPLLLAGALAIVLTDGFPVVFAQERTGRELKPFRVYKLRTMVNDAEKLSGPVLAEEDDPRITVVGKILRKYRIDELPQLFNILLGEMSLVGPRMISPPELKKYGQWGMNLLTVRPGLTGLWQVSGRSDVSYEERVRLDMFYIRNYSVWLDIQVILKTIPSVLFKRGAY